MSFSTNARYEVVKLFGVGIILYPAIHEIMKYIKKKRDEKNLKSQKNPKKVAIVLSGCGVFDGSEITEAVSLIIHLHKHPKIQTADIFAPNKDQSHTINHYFGEEDKNEGTKRNILDESARIARGKISDIVQLKANNYDAVFFPGGFGIAKNLSSYAVKGLEYEIDSEVHRVLSEFRSLKKPIGLICIAPILAPKVFDNCELTIGVTNTNDTKKWPYAGTGQDLKKLGATVIEKELNECHVDIKNKIVTAPAYMCDTTPDKIYDNIGLLVIECLNLTM